LPSFPIPPNPLTPRLSAERKNLSRPKTLHTGARRFENKAPKNGEHPEQNLKKRTNKAKYSRLTRTSTHNSKKEQLKSVREEQDRPLSVHRNHPTAYGFPHEAMSLDHPYMQTALSDFTGHSYHSLANHFNMLQANSYRAANADPDRAYMNFPHFLVDQQAVSFVRLADPVAAAQKPVHPFERTRLHRLQHLETQRQRVERPHRVRPHHQRTGLPGALL